MDTHRAGPVAARPVLIPVPARGRHDRNARAPPQYPVDRFDRSTPFAPLSEPARGKYTRRSCAAATPAPSTHTRRLAAGLNGWATSARDYSKQSTGTDPQAESTMTAFMLASSANAGESRSAMPSCTRQIPRYRSGRYSSFQSGSSPRFMRKSCASSTWPPPDKRPPRREQTADGPARPDATGPPLAICW